MTSDAKIGLLLGLIFIFIIAFILNGLPGLHGRGSSNQATAQDLSNLSTESFNSPPVQPTGVASGLGAPAWRGNDEVRYQAPLGGTTTTDTVVSAEPVADEHAESVAVVSADDTAASTPVASDGGLVDISSEAAPEASVDAVSQNDDSVAADASASGVSKAGTEYTIQSGDSPAKIAMKFYGAQEGNRIVNIDRLMAANKIADPTKLKVGKKIAIPALPNGPEKLTALNPESFVKVEPGATRTATATKADIKTETKTAAKADARTDANPSGTKEYVVAQGDSLWTISAKALGSGARYKEILKLNSKLGKDGSKLAVGMKLRIPAQ